MVPGIEIVMIVMDGGEYYLSFPSNGKAVTGLLWSVCDNPCLCCRAGVATVRSLPLGLHGAAIQPPRPHHPRVLPRLVPRLHPHRAVPDPQLALPLPVLPGLPQPTASQGIGEARRGKMRSLW